MTETIEQPSGDMLLRTLAMPADTNPSGDIFGGWIMSQMDMAGGILAKQVAQGRVVTVAVESIHFIKPVYVGDVVCCYGKIIQVGNTSITIDLEVWVRRVSGAEGGRDNHYKVTRAAFTYVSVDEKGNKRPIKDSICPIS
ncbi:MULTISPECIES: acyl-CoA thioester hydrolase YciA [Desulfosediminicola]|uniref:acyl-CoA thioester hydrolase YciA n=1 Tax=Desulfosediminicola TaxID=2886823 RepID=UPI0010AC2BA3|nr:acyl-CoA thioester hydrolase YciA [Desulfosediminicola ganghwensis]